MTRHAQAPYAIVVFSGPSGAGKGVLIQTIGTHFPQLSLAVSATTRSPRPNESDGEAYHFLSNAQFDAAIAQDRFIEWCAVHGNRYGTLFSEIDRIQHQKKHVLLEIDTQGAQRVKALYPHALLLFIAPPSLDILRKRLTSRNTENLANIEKRLQHAAYEMGESKHYDCIIINDTITRSSAEIRSLLEKRLHT